MRQEMKYKIRRLVAAFILMLIFMAFTVSVLVKTDAVGKLIDSEFARQDAVLEAHFNTHGIDR